MKMSEITQKTDKELAVALADGRKQVAQLTIDLRTKQVANVKQLHGAKRTVARLLTAQRLRELAQPAPAAAEVTPAEPEAATPTKSAKEENHG
jgi:ribosomal protein L29